jgi:alkanesulfonate monooxygenase SsuD/methylene tetrahydromethanopterin reductase-like flavin-dependent oxidoreductase (luciferase family)
MEERMEVGVFDHFDANDLSQSDFYEMRLKLCQAYEAAGFYSYHISEHHFTPIGMAPSPNVFLGSLAQRTTKLRFGPLVYALPLHHPLRLMEEICMLDQISKGRLDIGFGRGSSSIEADYLNQKNAQNIYAEGLELILKGFAATELDFDGDVFQARNIPIQLNPYQKPHPPLWYGVHSEESSERAAKSGINIVSADTSADTRRFVERYRTVWAAENGAKPTPKIGLMRFVFVGPDDETALNIARRAYLKWHKSFHYLFRRHGTAPRLGERPPTFDDVIAHKTGIAGSPKTVLAFLNDEMSEADANYFVGQFAFGDLSLEEAVNSVQLFRDDVMPHLRSGQRPTFVAETDSRTVSV